MWVKNRLKKEGGKERRRSCMGLATTTAVRVVYHIATC
jgi:hypothetical protein